MEDNQNSKNWRCIHCKAILTLVEAKEHAKLGGYHACYPYSPEENHD